VVTFDEALPRLVGACEQAPGFTSLKTACVVRDLRGRLRLLLAPAATQPGVPATPVDVAALQAQLVGDLGSYFAPPIWSTESARQDEARLARVLIGQALEWPEASFGDTDNPTTSQAHWKKLERRLSKQTWLESAGSAPPWNLAASTPSIITFYSFKGGVGRTTSLVACAWQLARAGKKVVAIDLDLEAPGLGALLDVKTERGVVDLLADYLATGDCDLDRAVAGQVDAFGAGGERVSVIPAGRLDAGYLEKLARLDFLNSNPPAPASAQPEPSPIEQALRGILQTVRKKLAPDFILLDSRAGLHDLAGLSLHSLAHVDVLVGRASEQGYRGFDLTLGVLAKRKGPDKLQCIVAHTFVEVEGSGIALEVEAEFLQRTYVSFVKHVYGPQNVQTNSAADDGMHRPVVIRRHTELDRFPSLQSVEYVFFFPDFVALRTRIETICTSGARA
jgi:MinD-like ATPase involved in chromosome partitioning or flagellar assembly